MWFFYKYVCLVSVQRKYNIVGTRYCLPDSRTNSYFNDEYIEVGGVNIGKQ